MKTLLLIDNQDITREGMKTVAGRIGGFAAIKEGLSCNSWGITLCNFPFMHTPLLIYTGRTSYLPLHEMKP